ncbi:regulatory helix-turn-helix protein, lysR family [Bradyrhizobium brasilense]|uniref:Regulatory helix-turn-helix protein, lysR family n=1 Tax=Bradyrhizobium brasilense TaxID=1419277 RepID=A0A1G7KSH5_9BRAD|nr:LysR family transcriptional regulator [Bradyrhizobium brasilense]SDF39689.1 regulatory helix-turn-helix protein, lysR family [Bradyrhizobium brasilense]
MQHLDPDLLRAFVMVTETSSFTKASERLFRTQAAISMQIKRLEDRIGKPLFVRGPHGTQLTIAGELLIHYARRILLLNDEALANLSVSQADDVVRIGVSDDYARILLPDVLLLFNKVYPHTIGARCRGPSQLGSGSSRGKRGPRRIDQAFGSR